MHASDRYLLFGMLEDLRNEEGGAFGDSKRLAHGEAGKALNDYEGIFGTLKRKASRAGSVSKTVSMAWIKSTRTWNSCAARSCSIGRSIEKVVLANCHLGNVEGYCLVAMVSEGKGAITVWL